MFCYVAIPIIVPFISLYHRMGAALYHRLPFTRKKMWMIADRNLLYDAAKPDIRMPNIIV